MNIKSDAKNKWLIDPENGDGFVLMWGCVRSNYGLRLPVKTTERTHLPPLIIYQVRVRSNHQKFQKLISITLDQRIFAHQTLAV